MDFLTTISLTTFLTTFSHKSLHFFLAFDLTLYGSIIKKNKNKNTVIFFYFLANINKLIVTT